MWVATMSSQEVGDSSGDLTSEEFLNRNGDFLGVAQSDLCGRASPFRTSLGARRSFAIRFNLKLITLRMNLTARIG